MEFIINNVIRIHPLALSRFDQLEDAGVRREIDALTRGYDDKTEYFVEKLARGVAAIAASQYPNPAIVRMSDFKTNEYDLTQLILGIDRDSAQLKGLFDERSPAVKVAIAEVVRRAQENGCRVGICGQAPSDFPESALFLVKCGIDSISLNPDSVVAVIEALTRR